MEDISKLNAIRICKIASIVRNYYLDTVYIRRNIYNVRTRLCRLNFDNYIFISILFKAFNSEGIEYIKKIDLEDEIKLLGIIFILPRCIYMAKKFLEIIIINNTYNTNRFNYLFY